MFGQFWPYHFSAPVGYRGEALSKVRLPCLYDYPLFHLLQYNII